MSQWADRILMKLNDHPAKPRVVICAFTGKAASLIGGITVHSAFAFINNSKSHDPLGAERLAELRNSMSELKLIIIDEISMIGADMLYQIHMRLCEVLQYDVAELFANVGIVLVGDLLQVAFNLNHV